MRKFRLHRPFPVTVLSVLFLIFAAGCTRSILQTHPASDREVAEVSEAFTRYVEQSAAVCGCCLDAEAEVELSVSGWFRDRKGLLSGYLQAMAPGFMKYVAVNPLGQPFFVFTTDGSTFTALNIFEEKAYIGSVQAGPVRKFAPQGFAPEFSYFWLTGRLQPQAMKISGVRRDNEQGIYWLQLDHAGTGTDSMVRFDPGRQVVLQHVLRDGRGSRLADVWYEDYLPLPGRKAGNGNSGENICRLPMKIRVSANDGDEEISVTLYSLLPDPDLAADDFQVEIPDNFNQFPVD